MTGDAVMPAAAAKAAKRYGLDPKDVLSQAKRMLKSLSDGEAGH